MGGNRSLDGFVNLEDKFNPLLEQVEIVTVDLLRSTRGPRRDHAGAEAAAQPGMPSIEPDSGPLLHPGFYRCQRHRQRRRIGAAGLRHVGAPAALAADLLSNEIHQLAGLELAG